MIYAHREREREQVVMILSEREQREQINIYNEFPFAS